MMLSSINPVIQFVSNTIGLISADVPSTKRILKILEPTMLPIARSASPFLAADSEVTSSGREVPNATIVSPIRLSDIPSPLAIVFAPFTTACDPKITSAIPTASFPSILAISTLFFSPLFSSFSSESGVSSSAGIAFLSFFERTIRYAKNIINIAQSNNPSIQPS